MLLCQLNCNFTNTNMDFNMIVSINTKTHEVLFTSMPRDYYIEVDGYNGKKDTLSYMGALGITTNMKSIEKLFNIKIDYYLSIKTTSLVRLVDEVGGINYCSDDAYTTTHAMILDSYDDTKGKKLFVKALLEEGVDTIFGYPGGTVTDLFDELYNLIFAKILNLPRAANVYKKIGFKFMDYYKNS